MFPLITEFASYKEHFALEQRSHIQELVEQFHVSYEGPLTEVSESVFPWKAPSGQLASSTSAQHDVRSYLGLARVIAQ